MKHSLVRWPISRWLLLLWIVFCAIWVGVGIKPWQTHAFDFGTVRKVPVRDYMHAGLWIGLLVSGLIAVMLLVLQRWWGQKEAAPVPVRFGPVAAPHRAATLWFGAAILVILCYALVQRWPAMSRSFWGDEGWMFCDYVHGKWQPTSKGASMQGTMRFNPVPWKQTFFGDQSGNNHWLSSVLQRLVLKASQWAGGHPEWFFRENIVRIVSLIGGLGSLLALAGWIRWMGRPVAAVVATAFMALHPWHVRFSVEARGYSLMLLFFILALWALGVALRKGRSRDWLLFGLAQFFMMYSWKGGVYALVFVNVITLVYLLRGRMADAGMRRVALARWGMAGLLGALLFIPLAMPSQLQMRKSIEEIRRRAKPMEEQWRKDAVAEILTGIPWVDQDPGNPRHVSLQHLARTSAWIWPATALVAMLLLVGMGRLFRQDPFLAWLCVAVLASGLLATLHFKHGLRVELLTWYLLYNLPVLALLVAVAVSPAPASVPEPAAGGILPDASATAIALPAAAGWSLAGAGVLTIFSWLGASSVLDFQRYPRENLKRAWKMTRGRHETRSMMGPSKVFTAWLWRHTYAYDPRGDMYVRNLPALREKLRLVRETQGEFYMIVGIRDLSEAICPDVMKVLHNPAYFDHMGTLWGVESLNTLDVYHLRPNAPELPSDGGSSPGPSPGKPQPETF